MDAFIRDHWQSIVAAVVIVAVASFVWKWMRPGKKVFAEGMTLNVRCNKCSWQGTVTKYNQVCRKCGGRDLLPF